MKNKLLSTKKIDLHTGQVDVLVTSGTLQKVTRYFLNHWEDFQRHNIKTIDDILSKLDSGQIKIESRNIDNKIFKEVFAKIFPDHFQPIVISDLEKILRFYHKVIDHEITGNILAGPQMIEFTGSPCYFPCVTEVVKDENDALEVKADLIFDTINKIMQELPRIIITIPKNFQFTFIYFKEMFKDIAQSKQALMDVLNKIPEIETMTSSEMMNKLVRVINSDYVNDKMMGAFIKEYEQYDGLPLKELEFLVYQIMFQYELKEPYQRSLMDHVLVKASDKIQDKHFKDEFYQYLQDAAILDAEGKVLRDVTTEEEKRLTEQLVRRYQETIGSSKEFLTHDYHRSRSPYTKGGSRYYNYFNMANNFSVVMDLLLDYLNQIGSSNYVEKSNIAGKVILKDWLAPYYDFTMFREAETFVIDQKNTLSGSTSPLSQAALSRNVNLLSLDTGSFTIFKEFLIASSRIKLNPALNRMYFSDGIVSLKLTADHRGRIKPFLEESISGDSQIFGKTQYRQPVQVSNNINSIDGLYHNESDIGLIKMEYIMNSSVMDLPTYEAYLIYYGLAVEKTKKNISISLIDITAENDFRGYYASDMHEDGRVDDGLSWEINHPQYNNLQNQLKALITVAIKYPEKNIEIILPKVRHVSEIEYVDKLLDEQLEQLTGTRQRPKNLSLGIMVETLTLLNNEIFELYNQAKPLEVNLNNDYLRLSENLKDDKEIKKMLISFLYSQQLLDNNGYPIRLFTRDDTAKLKNFLDSLYDNADESLYILLKDIVIGACQGFMDKRRNYLDHLFNQQSKINKVEEILLMKGADQSPLIKKIIIGSNRLDQSVKGQLKGMQQEGSYSYIYFIIMRNLSDTVAQVNNKRGADQLKVAVCGKSASDERFVPVMLSFFPDNPLNFATKNQATFEFLKSVIKDNNLEQVDHLIQEIINKKDSTYTILQKLDNLSWNILP